VLGLRRGLDLARNAEAAGLRVVAICDADQARLDASGASPDIALYTDFDQLLQHPADAVVLANHFHQHAPFAIAALDAGRDVLSEITACMTGAEAVALVRAVERSDRVYMLAENWQFTAYNQEMRRLALAGEIGKFLYGEAEYVHPMSAATHNDYSPGANHWRNWIPATYYCTHSLGPLMYVTDTWPAAVNGFVVAADPEDPQQQATPRVNDTASVIMVRNRDGSLCKLLQYGLRGEGLYTRVHGNLGMMENLREGDQARLRVKKESFDDPEGRGYERVYTPPLPPAPVNAEGSGHAGADLFVSLAFADAVTTRRPAFFDVHRAVTMSMVGIQAWRSALRDGAPEPVPDLREEAARAEFENDHWSPDPAAAAEGQPPTGVSGNQTRMSVGPRLFQAK
jgi:predicted dehydrogenase